VLRRKFFLHIAVSGVYPDPFRALEERRSSRPLRAGPFHPTLLKNTSPLKNPIPGFDDRLKASAEAKKAMLAKLKPKAAVQDPNFDQRHAEREAEREAIRAARNAERDAKKQAAADAEAAREAVAQKAREEADQARRLSQREQLMQMYGRKRR